MTSQFTCRYEPLDISFICLFWFFLTVNSTVLHRSRCHDLCTIRDKAPLREATLYLVGHGAQERSEPARQTVAHWSRARPWSHSHFPRVDRRPSSRPDQPNAVHSIENMCFWDKGSVLLSVTPQARLLHRLGSRANSCECKEMHAGDTPLYTCLCSTAAPAGIHVVPNICCCVQLSDGHNWPRHMSTTFCLPCWTVFEPCCGFRAAQSRTINKSRRPHLAQWDKTCFCCLCLFSIMHPNAEANGKRQYCAHVLHSIRRLAKCANWLQIHFGGL